MIKASITYPEAGPPPGTVTLVMSEDAAKRLLVHGLLSEEDSGSNPGHIANEVRRLLEQMDLRRRP